MEQKTHWKKNNDSRYINGEDLRDGLDLAKGLKPLMNVEIVSFEDAKTFDQKNQEDQTRTGFHLRDLETGKMLYKPMILNATNARFCINEFQSKYMEDWLNKPITLYAQADKRHGFVARFRKHFAKPTVTPQNATNILNASTTIEELAENWGKLSKEEKNLPVIMKLKEDLKTKLTPTT
jgi:beta-glucosidase-like glycosyl hydrolase